MLNHYTRKGKTWKDIPKVFQVSVVNFIFDRSSPVAISHYQMRTEAERDWLSLQQAYEESLVIKAEYQQFLAEKEQMLAEKND